jgi:hypothetical protein
MVEDLEEAIRIGRELLEIAAPNDSRRPAFLSNLSLRLEERYALQGSSVDLQEAIRLMRESISGIELKVSHRLAYMNNLGLLLARLYRRTKNLAALDEAISVQREVVRDSSFEHPMRPSYLNNLSNSLEDKFTESKDLKELDEAIILSRDAIAIIPFDHLDLANLMNSQGSRYYTKFSETKDDSDLDLAIQSFRKSTDAFEKIHPNRASSLHNLAVALRHRHQIKKLAQDRDEGKRAFADALNQSNALPIVRIEAGRSAGLLHGDDHEWVQAYAVFKTAVLLLSKVSPRSIMRDDQQYNLSGLSGISSLACSAALQAGRSAAESLEILETGRGIISGLATYSNNDISQLELRHPKLAARYKELRDMAYPNTEIKMELVGNARDSSRAHSSNNAQTPALFTSFENHRNYADELERLETEIRRLPGFSKFQLPPPPDQILSLASTWPIICFNVTAIRSDAILITKSDIKSIRLEKLAYPDLQANAAALSGKGKLSAGGPSSKPARNVQLRNLLKWLWDVAVMPVLQELDILSPNKQKQLPRVFWMASGLMSMVPIHAAGRHENDATENTDSHVVSSYVTTLKALNYSREGPLERFSLSSQRIMVVAMPKTPGMNSLKAIEETDAIDDICRRFSIRSPATLIQCSKQDVKKGLQSCDFAHFACHGNSDTIDPSNGGLYLGREDRTVAEHLTIREIAEMLPLRAHLAYLSACSTAENSTEELIDEIIHAASGFQLIGFMHVIGSLWETGNTDALEVAGNFYEALFKSMNGQEESNFHDAVAYSLQEAVSRLKIHGSARSRRKLNPSNDVLAWAPFIHIGA